MFEDKTYEKLLQEKLALVSNNIDKRQGSLIYDAMAPNSAEMAQVYIDIEYVANKLDVENLEGEELEQFINQRTGIKRKTATKAIRKGIFKKADSSFFNVSLGDRFTGEDLYYVVTEKITDGEFKIESEITGDAGNVYTGLLMPVNYIDGLATAELTDVITSGYEAESDESLLERYYERIQTPATSGNKYQYRNWAKEVAGVGDAKVIPLWAGDNTVKVIIINSNKQPTSAELVTTVQNYIDPGVTGLGEGAAPVGAYCTIESATGKTIDITFTATKDTGITDQERQDSVEDNIRQYFCEIAFKTDDRNNPLPISYAKVGAYIMNSVGILDYADLLINGESANIVITNNEVPVLGTVTIT